MIWLIAVPAGGTSILGHNYCGWTQGGRKVPLGREARTPKIMKTIAAKTLWQKRFDRMIGDRLLSLRDFDRELFSRPACACPLGSPHPIRDDSSGLRLGIDARTEA